MAGQEYGDKSYWDNRYVENGSVESGVFEWYVRYVEFAAVFNRSCGTSGRVLHIGCGNSNVAGDAALANVDQSHVCVDFSSVVIANMKKRNVAHPARDRLEYLEMDVSQMTFDAGSFDAVFDKGTLDAILCGRDSFQLAAKTVLEVFRVLKPGGTYVLMTYGDPSLRLDHLKTAAWASIDHEVLNPIETGDDADATTAKKNKDGENRILHHLYICKKPTTSVGEEKS